MAALVTSDRLNISSDGVGCDGETLEGVVCECDSGCTVAVGGGNWEPVCIVGIFFPHSEKVIRLYVLIFAIGTSHTHMRIDSE